MQEVNKSCSDKFKVCAVVVTHNRKELLRECLQALLAQTRPLDEIIVIDNASTDGTNEMVLSEFPQVTYVRLPENTGGAGGFHEGIKLAYEKGHDWIWVMDDDTVPEREALFNLLSKIPVDEQVGLLYSHVVWIDGSAHIMNPPFISPLIHQANANPVPFNEHAEKGMFRIYRCSFVSTLISRNAIKDVGLPIKEMFLYGDDAEFTTRLCKKFPCYYVPASKVIHKTSSNKGLDWESVPDEHLWKYFYVARNETYCARKQGFLKMIAFLLITLPTWLKQIKRRQKRLKAIKICFQGILAGLIFNPKVGRP